MARHLPAKRVYAGSTPACASIRKVKLMPRIKEEEWMLVTKEHINNYHDIHSDDLRRDHLIAHVVGNLDHKHYTSDLKAPLK